MRILAAVALVFLMGTPALGAAGECGGTTVCACGDRVVEDYTMSADLGPCLEADSGGEIVGLRLKSDVVLDCAGFAILGPDDAQKEEFGIRIGTKSGPVSGVGVRGCEISGFWWGIYVASSSAIVVEDNYIHDNGWKDPNANGTGYGIDVARSSDVLVRANRIEDNGNEGIHLSASQAVVVEGNTFVNNGFEQIYLINADENEIRGNTTTGGTQGLEMRDSSRNQFSYNRFLGSPKQWLENDNHENEFVYDEFAGRVDVSADSTGNRFSHGLFSNPEGTCIRVRGTGTSLDRAWMHQCKIAVDTWTALTLERTMGAAKIKRKKLIDVVSPGCNADLNGDGLVDAVDRAMGSAPLGLSVGEVGFDPAADLDRDGVITLVDRAYFDWQAGDCPRRSLKRPPASLAIKVLDNRPRGEADRVLFTAAGTGGAEERVVAWTLEVRQLPLQTVLFAQQFGDVARATVAVELELAPGLYQATLTTEGPFHRRSRTRKGRIRVR